MSLSLILCISCVIVGFVGVGYGAISIYKIHKEEKELKKKERTTEYLCVSTGWIMWADAYGIKISSITPIEEIKHGFTILFDRRSSNIINNLLSNSNMLSLLKGHFKKLDNGKYCFVNTSLDESWCDVGKLIQYSNSVSAYTTKLGGNGCLDKYIP